MALDDSLSERERSKLAVWDYPVSDKYTKIWSSMQVTDSQTSGMEYNITQDAGLPATFEEALERVRGSPSSSEGFAFLGQISARKQCTVHRLKLVL